MRRRRATGMAIGSSHGLVMLARTSAGRLTCVGFAPAPAGLPRAGSPGLRYVMTII